MSIPLLSLLNNSDINNLYIDPDFIQPSDDTDNESDSLPLSESERPHATASTSTSNLQGEVSQPCISANTNNTLSIQPFANNKI